MALLSLSWQGVFAQSNGVNTEEALLREGGKGNVQGDLESEISSVQEQIKQKEGELEEVQGRVASLENKLAELRIKIEKLTAEINLTKAKIAELKHEIALKQAELDHQREVLAETLRTLYKKGNVSTLQLIIASDSFGEFVNEQEYLERLKLGIQDSVDSIAELKKQLEVEEIQQNELLEQQESQEVVLQTSKKEQAVLLEQTKGEESAYQEQLSELRAKQAKAEQALKDYLASLIGGGAVNLGPVVAGQVVGKLGNTGYSTGAHTHFSMYDSSGADINPNTVMSQNGWGWPVGGSGGYVSQGYGCTPWGPYSQRSCPAGWGWHDAIDIAAPEGTPLVAVASGIIVHRGCLYEGTIFATFMVIIDHGNGYYSSYAHMQAPNSPKFSGCNRNTLSGNPSIDYDTTQ